MNENMIKRINKTIEKYGEFKCVEAYRLCVEQGEGPAMVANELGVHHNATAAMCRAGEALMAWQGVKANDVFKAGIALLRAMSPVTTVRLRHEFQYQVLNVTSEYGQLITQWFIAEALRHEVITVEDEDGADWVDLTDAGYHFVYFIPDPFVAWGKRQYLIVTMHDTYTYVGTRHGFGQYANHLGFGVKDVFPPTRTVSPKLTGEAILANMAGPMLDGDKIRYESWQANDFLSC